MNKAVLFVGGALAAGMALVMATPSRASGEILDVDEKKIDNFANAIAFAEGYHTANLAIIAGSVPARFNNPGDLGPGDVSGYASEFHSGSQVVKFPDASTGWFYLKNKLRHIFAGQSKVYNTSMTISEMAKKYAADSENWAKNVALFLGVSVSTTLEGWYKT